MRLLHLRTDERGATAIEYSLVATLIAIAAIGAFTQLGTRVGDTYNEVRNCVAGAANC